MNESIRLDYFRSIQRELNPSIFVTEWMSHRLMDVEWSIGENANDTTKRCILGINEFLTARNFTPDLVQKVLINAPASPSTKSEFTNLWQHPDLPIESTDADALALLAIYCFTHVAFTYER